MALASIRLLVFITVNCDVRWQVVDIHFLVSCLWPLSCSQATTQHVTPSWRDGRFLVIVLSDSSDLSLVSWIVNQLV